MLKIGISIESYTHSGKSISRMLEHFKGILKFIFKMSYIYIYIHILLDPYIELRDYIFTDEELHTKKKSVMV